MEPLLVRPLEPSKFEVVIGARRLKAARLAELESVPVRVKQMTDAEAIEVQLVENLQREDIHPLEESLGFRSLLQLGDPTYTIASIAARAGKSEAYVQGRIKLADLIPPVAEAFLKDTITIGHALLIAKLPDSQQQEAFNAAFRGMWVSEGNQQVLIPVRELAAWIESNILLQLASAPFDKQDEALVPAAGSCANCPKRTGFNKLLFADVRKDSCTDPQCFRSKIDAHVSKTLESKPQLVQISSAWNTREGAPLGRNRYVELELKKAKTNGTGSKSVPYHKPCEKMTEAVVMDGGRRGELVKVCADLSCRVHHPDTPSPDQIAKERADERKRIEENKQAITTRHYLLAKVLERVSAPIQPLELETWLKELGRSGLKNQTRAKIRQVMALVYKHAQRVGFLPRTEEANPMRFVRQSTASNFEPIIVTPSQAFAIINQLELRLRTLVLVSAATALRISEILALQWNDIDFDNQCIHVRRAYVYGQFGKPKSKASKRPVPLHPVLAAHLLNWRRETPHSKQEDLVFPSLRLNGSIPPSANMLLSDHLRPAAARIGVIAPARVFGFHTFRRTLASVLVANNYDPKLVQELLRHSNIRTTLDIYAQAITPAKLEAQGVFLTQLFSPPPKEPKAEIPHHVN